MSDQLTRKQALDRIKSDGVEPVLRAAGFARSGTLSWTRQTPELQHIIMLLGRRGLYDVQWGIASPEVVPIMWGREYRAGDVGDSIVSGTPGTIRHPPACQSFRLDDANDGSAVEQIATNIALDLEAVQARLADFGTRRELRAYLLQTRDQKDRRDFVIPAALPLKLMTAASLACVDHDPEASALATEAEAAMSRFRDELSLARLARLRCAVAKIAS
jgi:hypothetical protein